MHESVFLGMLPYRILTLSIFPPWQVVVSWPAGREITNCHGGCAKPSLWVFFYFFFSFSHRLTNVRFGWFEAGLGGEHKMRDQCVRVHNHKAHDMTLESVCRAEFGVKHYWPRPGVWPKHSGSWVQLRDGPKPSISPPPHRPPPGPRETQLISSRTWAKRSTPSRPFERVDKINGCLTQG
jgi:hypothetical protein